VHLLVDTKQFLIGMVKLDLNFSWWIVHLRWIEWRFFYPASAYFFTSRQSICKTRLVFLWFLFNCLRWPLNIKLFVFTCLVPYRFRSLFNRQLLGKWFAELYWLVELSKDVLKSLDFSDWVGYVRVWYLLVLRRRRLTFFLVDWKQAALVNGWIQLFLALDLLLQ
jgi:hypothetical protein